MLMCSQEHTAFSLCKSWWGDTYEQSVCLNVFLYSIRLQAKASKNLQEVKNDFENFLHKLRVEAKLKEEYRGSASPSESLQSLQSPNSSLSSPAMSEDFNSVEEGGLKEARSDHYLRTTHSSFSSINLIGGECTTKSTFCCSSLKSSHQ